MSVDQQDPPIMYGSMCSGFEAAWLDGAAQMDVFHDATPAA